MDSNNWRPNQGTKPTAVDTIEEWRHAMKREGRRRIVNKIMETLKKHLPCSGPDGLLEVRKIAQRFEEKIFAIATSQADYVRKICWKMVAMETKSQNSFANNMPSNQVGSSSKQTDQVPLAAMREKEIREYIKRILVEKQITAGKQSGQSKKRKETKQTRMKEKRQNLGEPSQKEHEDIIILNNEANMAPWMIAVRRVTDECYKLEEDYKKVNKESEVLKKSKYVLSKDVVRFKKDWEKELKKSIDLENKLKVEKEKYKNELVVEKGISYSLKLEMSKKDEEIEKLKMEVALQRSLGFEKAVDQVKCLYPNLDLSAMDVLKVVKDGAIVEPEDNWFEDDIEVDAIIEVVKENTGNDNVV